MNQISKKDFIEEISYKSLIGKEIKVLNSKVKNQVDLEGKIVYETAKFFHIQKNTSIIKIFKQNVQLEIFIKGKPLKVDGRLLLGTLTQRIKKIK